MRNLILISILLVAGLASAQERVIQTTPFSRTLLKAATQAEAQSIIGSTGGGATNGIQMLNGSGTNTTLVTPVVSGGTVSNAAVINPLLSGTYTLHGVISPLKKPTHILCVGDSMLSQWTVSNNVSVQLPVPPYYGWPQRVQEALSGSLTNLPANDLFTLKYPLGYGGEQIEQNYHDLTNAFANPATYFLPAANDPRTNVIVLLFSGHNNCGNDLNSAGVTNSPTVIEGWFSNFVAACHSYGTNCFVGVATIVDSRLHTNRVNYEARRYAVNDWIRTNLFLTADWIMDADALLSGMPPEMTSDGLIHPNTQAHQMLGLAWVETLTRPPHSPVVRRSPDSYARFFKPAAAGGIYWPDDSVGAVSGTNVFTTNYTAPRLALDSYGFHSSQGSNFNFYYGTGTSQPWLRVRSQNPAADGLDLVDGILYKTNYGAGGHIDFGSTIKMRGSFGDVHFLGDDSDTHAMFGYGSLIVYQDGHGSFQTLRTRFGTNSNPYWSFAGTIYGQTNSFPSLGPETNGAWGIWNSNGTPYLLTTTPGGTTWDETNLIANGHYKARSSNAALTLTKNDQIVFCTGTNQPVTLADAATLTSGQTVTIVVANINGSALVTNSTGSQTILGALSITVPATNRITVISDGSNYW